MKPTFFRSAAEFRKWLERHHDTTSELWVGFYKKTSGKSGISYSDALDQALCFGWIDGLKKTVDEAAYTHRFSPRKPRSVWSNINIRRAEQLKRAGLLQPPGLAAFGRRDPARSGIYSFENPQKTLAPPLERRFKANRKAWKFFQAQPAGYRRLASFWIMGAKQDATRERRFDQLMQASEKGKRRV